MQYILQHYAQSFHFFKTKLIKLSILMTILFFSIIAISVIYLKNQPEIVDSMLSAFMDMINSNGIVSDTGNISSIALMMNNMKACLLSIGLGIIPFIFLPLFSLFSNAVLIGALCSLYVMFEVPAVSLFAGLIPHGIFEIPALIISMALGVYLCKELTMKLCGKRMDLKIIDIFGSIMNFYVCIIVPLLIIAGVIEAYITPIIMELAM